MKISTPIKKMLYKLPYINSLYKQSLNSAFPNGHFYSPIVSIDEIKKRELDIWKNVGVDGIDGINLRTNEQKIIVQKFEKYYSEMPFKSNKQPSLRYYFDNEFYSYTDGILLYSMIREFRPKRIIEVGSGFSSAVMLDTNELFFNHQINLTFIDPYADRLFSLMNEKDKETINVIQSDVQLLSLDVFSTLEAGDIL